VDATYTNTGTYSVNGNVVTKQWPTNLVPFHEDYCVRGNRLVEETPGGVQYVMEKVP
jgi:hypothetical protein